MSKRVKVIVRHEDNDLDHNVVGDAVEGPVCNVSRRYSRLFM